MATIINEASITNSYSSGPVDVSSYRELVLDMTPTEISTAFAVNVTVSRIGADGNLYNLSTITMQYPQPISLAFGAGLPVNTSFGDAIQIDLNLSEGDTIDTSLSLIGK